MGEVSDSERNPVPTRSLLRMKLTFVWGFGARDM